MRWLAIGLVALVIAGVVTVGVLDRFELVEGGALLRGGLKRVQAFRPYVRTYELGLAQSQALARERMQLEDARLALALKAQEIAKQEADLERRRKASEQELAELEKKRNELLKAINGTEQLDRMAKLCGAMPIPGAVRLLSELEDGNAAQVLMRLPEKQAGAILAGIEPKRAAQIVALLIRQ